MSAITIFIILLLPILLAIAVIGWKLASDVLSTSPLWDDLSSNSKRVVPDNGNQLRTCHELGVCQLRSPPCSDCERSACLRANS